MSQQTIIWNQRVLGRDIGDVETLNTNTDLMQNLIAMGRVSVVEPVKATRVKPEIKVVEDAPESKPEV